MNWLHMHYTLAKRRLAAWLQNLSVKLGGPRAHYDGVPAALELDSIEHVFDELGVPRSTPCPDGSPWPLTPSQRARLLLAEHLAR